MTTRKQMDITHFQSECLIGYSRYANMSTMESSKLFSKFNLFEFISNCYDVLHLDEVEYVVKNDIANRINNEICYKA